ncbi:unnamed protein product [Lactuca saligna]|uniref:Glabrous enhancer-binding protein-like DBD domain-containing protein n=1 Tax=Lactuca saligna TaxID=75948 RepID=A0AA36EDG7_LACSI|nr:unnamed protein product [Lactuca saligna]
MDDSSNPRHSPPGSDEGSPPGFGSGYRSIPSSGGSTRESTPSVEVNPLPSALQPQSVGGSNSERETTTTGAGGEPKKEKNVTSHSTATKRRRTGLSMGKEKVDDGIAATRTPTPAKKQEINLLMDIIEFYNKNRTYPFDDSNDMKMFYKQWIKRRAVYAEEDVMSNKMVELHERFLMNLQKTLSGDDIEDWMDHTDVKIYRLSYRIWGKKDDTQDSSERTVSDN